MKMLIQDRNYHKIVKNILENEKFNEIDKIEHHGTTRMEHSLKVSYYSYVIAKSLRLDYRSTARAGLLHDFFISDNNRKLNEKFVSTFVHPKQSVINSRMFGLNELEENIIESHMFPIYKCLPKYAESWIVSTVDKVIGFKEFSEKIGKRLVYATNLVMLFLFTTIK